LAADVACNAKDYNCNTCQWGRHCDESNPHTYDAWKVTLYKEVIYEGRVCPKGTMGSFEMQMLRDHVHYKNGVLPFSGGSYEQPNVFMQTMAIIEQVYQEYGQAT